MEAEITEQRSHSPSPRPPTTGNQLSRLPSSPSYNWGSRSRMEEIAEEETERVHVAVGKLKDEAIGLLHWTFRQFGKKEICLVHVHQPSSKIPTLLGNLPASQANEEVVRAHRREEREQSKKLQSTYMDVCSRAKVEATVITIESQQVHKSIVELVKTHGIRKLVMGAVPNNFVKVKKNSSKVKYVAKNAPPFCEIWFINKGKHIWTREASEYRNFPSPMLTADEPAQAMRSSARSWAQVEPDQLEASSSSITSSFVDRISHSTSNLSSSSTGSSYAHASTSGSSEYDSKVEEDYSFHPILEAMTEAEASKNEAFAELLKRRKLESESFEAINKVQAIDAAYAYEVQQRKEVEDSLRTVRQEQEKLLEQREEISKELQVAVKDVSVLENRVAESHHRQSEAARDLSLKIMSLTAIKHDIKKIHQQKEKAVLQFERWKSHGQAQSSSHCEPSYINNSAKFRYFSLSDLQTATCNFAEGFKIGHGRYGCVYKGEISDRTIAIKKLNPLNMQGKLEFLQEVQAFSNLKHPNLVPLIGACPEVWSLVYDYLPSGSLQDHLFSKNKTHLLTWKMRTRIVANISSALFYLHSSKPEKIVHGNLKPENILLDAEFNSKIGDVGIRHLVLEETVRCPSFRGIPETKNAFPHTDPEFPTNEGLTPKSDIYSFGVIILQLLTGRSPVRLASEVRSVVLCENVASVLDTSAGEWPAYVARRLIEFGLKCCEPRSQDRPELTTMMVRELEQLHLAEERCVPSFFLCPILQEIMHDPHVAADGFTYEGEAIVGWLKNGRETSPMTNLKLSHLHLTPNHALRLAIQGWLCQR